MVLGIVKASMEILGIGIGVEKVVLLMSAVHMHLCYRRMTKKSDNYIHAVLSVPDFSWPVVSSNFCDGSMMWLVCK